MGHGWAGKEGREMGHGWVEIVARAQIQECKRKSILIDFWIKIGL
jgi:hypothetical protein